MILSGSGRGTAFFKQTFSSDRCSRSHGYGHNCSLELSITSQLARFRLVWPWCESNSYLQQKIPGGLSTAHGKFELFVTLTISWKIAPRSFNLYARARGRRDKWPRQLEMQMTAGAEARPTSRRRRKLSRSSDGLPRFAQAENCPPPLGPRGKLPDVVVVVPSPARRSWDSIPGRGGDFRPGGYKGPISGARASGLPGCMGRFFFFFLEELGGTKELLCVARDPERRMTRGLNFCQCQIEW